MIEFAIVALVFALATWMLWKSVFEDPDDFRRQADEFQDATANLKRRFWAVYEPPLLRLVTWLSRRRVVKWFGTKSP